jgi:hypothetical protein
LPWFEIDILLFDTDIIIRLSMAAGFWVWGGYRTADTRIFSPLCGE